MTDVVNHMNTIADRIASAARACAQGWVEQARAHSPRVWTASVQPADFAYLEREVLGREAHGHEAADFAAIFRAEYETCMAQKAAREGWDEVLDMAMLDYPSNSRECPPVSDAETAERNPARSRRTSRSKVR